MAHPRRRHYRVAQKAVEAQICQHEDDHRRDSIFALFLIILLITQLFSLGVKILELFYSGAAESYSD